MDDLFGLSMNYIMIALLILLAIALSTVAWVVLRNRVMFMIGVRNIPRRRAQTTLIIIGLMLSTLIISAAFSIGDTVNYSTTNQAYDRLHSVDEIVQAQSGDTNEDPFAGARSLISPLPIPQADANRFVKSFRDTPGVDGAVSVVRAPVPATNQSAGQSEPIIILLGAAADQMTGFSDIESTDGHQLSLDDLAADEVYVNASAADALDVKNGDAIRIFTGGQPHDLVARDVVKDRMLTGTAFGETKGMLTTLATAQSLLNRPNEVDLIAVSNDGGVRDGLDGSTPVTAALNETLQFSNWRAVHIKRDLVDTARELSSFLTTFFVVLGLFSIAAGLMLIFLIFVMLAAERKMEMGMTRAIGTKRRHLIQTYLSEGVAYNVMAAAVGAALGVAVSLVMVRIMAALFSAFDLSIVFHVTPRSLVVSYSLGVVLTFLTVTFSSWRVSNLNIVSAIRDISDSVSKRAGRWSLALGVIGVLIGILLVVTGYDAGQAFPFMAGVTLVSLGLLLVSRFAGAPPRPAFTSIGLFLLVVWLLGAGANLPLPKKLDGGIEMFFLSGIAMVTAMTFVLVYNADLLLGVLTLAGGVFSRLVPSIRTAVAYPLANKFRTGMTIAMISLVVFALVMMSTMNENFNRIFLSDEALGGYQVAVTENPTNPLGDLRTALQRQGFDTSGIARVDAIKVANQRVAQVRMAPSPDPAAKQDSFGSYPVLALSDSFIDNNDVKFQARAEGFATDQDVWRSVAQHPDQAVVDAFAIPSGGLNFGSNAFLDGVDSSDTTLGDVRVQIRDAAGGNTREVRIVGVISTRASGTFRGLYVPAAPFDALFPRPETTLHYVRLNDGADATETAHGIEKALLSQGAQAESLRKKLDDDLALNRGFNYLIQGFMGLGLFVGIAAVGVIAFRTVVERRQQIGMLRALGYTRNAVALSFIMESSFITLLGVLSGIGLGLLLAQQLVTSDNFDLQGVEFYIPWVQVAGIGLFAFVASLVMTIIPSRQASSIPIAEALRYE